MSILEPKYISNLFRQRVSFLPLDPVRRVAVLMSSHRLEFTSSNSSVVSPAVTPCDFCVLTSPLCYYVTGVTLTIAASRCRKRQQCWVRPCHLVQRVHCLVANFHSFLDTFFIYIFSLATLRYSNIELNNLAIHLFLCEPQLTPN